MINTATGTRNERKPPKAEKDNEIVFPKITIIPKTIRARIIISIILDPIHELIPPVPLFFSPPEMTIV